MIERLTTSIAPSTAPLRHAAAGAAAMVALAATAAAATYLYDQPPIRRLIDRARLAPTDHAEYLALAAGNDAARKRLHYDVDTHREEVRSKYRPDLFPGAPQQLEEFTVTGLVSAAEFARRRRDATPWPVDGDPDVWHEQAQALHDEIRHRHWALGWFKNPLDTQRLALAYNQENTAPPAHRPPAVPAPAVAPECVSEQENSDLTSEEATELALLKKFCSGANLQLPEYFPTRVAYDDHTAAYDLNLLAGEHHPLHELPVKQLITEITHTKAALKRSRASIHPDYHHQRTLETQLAAHLRALRTEFAHRYRYEHRNTLPDLDRYRLEAAATGVFNRSDEYADHDHIDML